MGDRLRRGFKAEAERLAQAVRVELGLTTREPLDPYQLARHLGVLVLPLTDPSLDVQNPESIKRLMSARSGFSALTVCAEDQRLIVFNPNHARGRKANSLTHELSHVLLNHPPQPALGPLGCRRWEAKLEAEADWLAATLLVPRVGGLWWMGEGGTIEGGAKHFGVSKALFKWRVNQTGVMRQLSAIRNKRQPSLSASVRDGIRDLSRGKPLMTSPGGSRGGRSQDTPKKASRDSEPREAVTARGSRARQAEKEH